MLEAEYLLANIAAAQESLSLATSDGLDTLLASNIESRANTALLSMKVEGLEEQASQLERKGRDGAELLASVTGALPGARHGAYWK